jgi:hypothetical protein
VARLLRLAELRIQATARVVGRIEVREGCVRSFRGHARDPLLQRGRLPQLTGRTVDLQLSALAKRLVEAAGKRRQSGRLGPPHPPQSASVAETRNPNTEIRNKS